MKNTNYNKLNPSQKEIMAQFMADHPKLAKNHFPNTAQGRHISNKLWESLSRRLNSEGPPTKDAKMWRKVYADQKYQAKKKLSDNLLSKKKTGGGPCSERPITSAEELIIEAAGLEAAVEGNLTTRSFGNERADSRNASQQGGSNSGSGSDDGSASSTSSCSSNSPGPSRSATTPTQRPSSRRNTPRRKRVTNEKLELLQQNMSKVSEFQNSLGGKLGRLVEVQEKLLSVQERMLKIKEEKHSAQQASRQIDLEIKNLELEALAISVNKQERKSKFG